MSFRLGLVQVVLYSTLSIIKPQMKMKNFISCYICHREFASNRNVRRHISEVHRVGKKYSNTTKNEGSSASVGIHQKEKLSEIELIRLRNIQERTEMLKKLKGLSKEVKELSKFHKPKGQNPSKLRQKLIIKRKLYATRSRVKVENPNVQDQKIVEFHESSRESEEENNGLIQRKFYATRSRKKAENPNLRDQKFINYYESSEDDSEEEENNPTMEDFEDDTVG